MKIKELLVELSKFDDIENPTGLNISEELDEEPTVDPFKAVKDALTALGATNVSISGVDDVYEIAMDNGNIFNAYAYNKIKDVLEDELNSMF